MQTGKIAPPYMPGQKHIVQDPRTIRPLSSKAQSLKDEFDQYVIKSNAYAVHALGVFWSHHNILNIGEYHTSQIRQGIIPTLINMLSSDVKPTDVFALECDYGLQNDVDLYIDGKGQESVDAFSRLSTHHTMANFMDLLAFAKQKRFEFVLIDPRPKGLRYTSRYWDERFIKIVTDRYGNNALNERRIIFYTGNAHACYSNGGDSLGDILRERLGKNRIITIMLNTLGLNFSTEDGEQFSVVDIVSKTRGRVIYLHHPGNPFNKIYFGATVKTYPVNQVCDGIIHY